MLQLANQAHQANLERSKQHFLMLESFQVEELGFSSSWG
jgi:hypothetical protein